MIKSAGLLSTCGGPLLVMRRLKGGLGFLAAFLIGFLPIALVMVGAFHLTDEVGDRWARWAVELDRSGMYVMVGMQLYGIWLILGGLRSPAQPLYYTGIATGLLPRWPTNGPLRDGSRGIARPHREVARTITSPSSLLGAARVR